MKSGLITAVLLSGMLALQGCATQVHQDFSQMTPQQLQVYQAEQIQAYQQRMAIRQLGFLLMGLGAPRPYYGVRNVNCIQTGIFTNCNGY